MRHSLTVAERIALHRAVDAVPDCAGLPPKNRVDHYLDPVVMTAWLSQQKQLPFVAGAVNQQGYQEPT